MSFLQIRDLEKSFGGLRVLKGLNIEIDAGGFLVLVGPSGCGKSTLLNAIAGLETIDGGDILLEGRSLTGLRPSARDMAMVFQSYALYPNMTVARNIAFGMEIRGVPKAERERAVRDVAETLQIGHLLKRRPSQLSGGQRQRVAMGRALVRSPRVFLFDEPLSNLDAKLRVDMRTEIKRLHQRLGATIVYVTHDQVEAMTLATHIAVLRDGALQQFATPVEIYNDPANLFVADFMGSPSMNLIPAVVERDGDGLVISMTRAREDALRLRVPQGLRRLYDGLGGRVGEEVIFGMRPEAIGEAAEAGDGDGGGVVSGECEIELVEPAGSDTYAVTTLGGVEVTARLRAESGVTAASRHVLTFALDRSVYFAPKDGTRLA
ncbi:MAG: ABC transporter ATP-binding protein [Alphaproteobacteria bacterium]|nr:ABC transporter ATP-binding protein [Alphaproteobacteria bacterium]MDA8004298.1 ABC transporter ATP-binding protein [Alphaproteobacteria bacterium]MDA8005524.1 ABC transporter ATP-binding protein [Alphaproteobacteria bacterium]MDA8012974.1 ABC transporter ATP-binding protein [Alphaproteobacteria bacterium]